MKLDPITLRLFVAVMEEQAIARAAAREHIATSAASRRLAELENQLKVRLFERSNRGIAPTPAAYRAHMQSWLRQVQPGSLVMCHPAAGVVQGDAIGTQRPKECAYLLSDEFVEDLQRFGRHIHQGGRLPEDNGSPKGGELH